MEHVVKFKWKDWKPVLILKHNENMKTREIELFSEPIDIEIGKLSCIGFRKNGKLFPCLNKNEISSGWQCFECVKKDDYARCVRCDGSTCFNPEQRPGCMKNDYYIYLAAFGDLLKVGMSYKHRSLQRFVEQGADFSARIAYLKDGRVARKLEQHIVKTLNTMDRVKGTQKFDQLFKDPGVSVKNITNAIDLLKESNINYLIEPEIEDLRAFYRLENIKHHPEHMEISSGVRMKGQVVACKGNLIFLENGQGTFAINSHRLVGRMVKVNNLNISA